MICQQPLSSRKGSIFYRVSPGLCFGTYLIQQLHFWIYKLLRYSRKKFLETTVYFIFTYTENRNHQLLADTAQKGCLSLNPLKSQVLLFDRKSLRNRTVGSLILNINDTLIPSGKSAKHLGLILDTSLYYDHYINFIIKRAYCNLKLIYGNRKMSNYL